MSGYVITQLSPSVTKYGKECRALFAHQTRRDGNSNLRRAQQCIRTRPSHVAYFITKKRERHCVCAAQRDLVTFNVQKLTEKRPQPHGGKPGHVVVYRAALVI